MSARALPFSRLLIANRGEVACRVIATARRLGLHTIALVGHGDHGAPHVRAADEAVDISADAPGGGYLDAAAILGAAAATGADALHPGYGFLAEDASFARACADAGLCFIGPQPEAIAAMADKLAARERAAALGVPVPEAVVVDAAEPARALAAVAELTAPLMVKPVAGGGGKGMHVVRDVGALPSVLERAAREAVAAFADARLLVERLLTPARHVEVQVLGDAHGAVVQLGTRECSVQRRRQKVIEEAPAPGLPAATEQGLIEAALALARGIGYRNAGTVEFLVLPDGDFRFLEMNTRLQVEHRVTESVYGLDLVAWQLRIAAGEPVPAQATLRARGHAIEARLCAEDPGAGLLPRSGRIALWRPPPPESDVLIDAGVDAGTVVSSRYDPLIAKVVAHGDDREGARRRLRQALAGLVVAGLPTNRSLLLAVLDDPAFIAVRHDTGWLEREAGRLAGWQPPLPAPAPVFGALAVLAARDADERHDPWAADAFRLHLPAAETLDLVIGGARQRLRVVRSGRLLRIDHQGRRYRCRLDRAGDALTAWVDGRGVPLTVSAFAHGLLVVVDGHAFEMALAAAGDGADVDEAAASGEVTAPMPGQVVALHVRPGARVDAGQPLLALSAMKMEHTLTAPCAGTVTAVRVAVGEAVAREGAVLVEIEPAE